MGAVRARWGVTRFGVALMQPVLERAYERLGPRYPQSAVVLQIQLGYLVWLLTLGVVALYIEMSAWEFARLFTFGLVFFVIHNLIYARITRSLLAPVTDWLGEERIEVKRLPLGRPQHICPSGCFAAICGRRPWPLSSGGPHSLGRCTPLGSSTSPPMRRLCSLSPPPSTFPITLP
jgi:hypothetical protein